MAITRWDPFAEISRLQSDMNRMWGDTNRAAFAPAVDIFEDGDAIVLKAEVPGMKADDIRVHVDNNVLTLEGERKLEKEEKKENYHRIERSYGSFTRSFVLPKTVDGEQIQASLDAGLLELRLPKKPAVQPRRIEVQS